MARRRPDRSDRMPRWMLRSVRCGPVLRDVERVLSEEGLNTVCVGARCPNRGECFSEGTATFMILGDNCTRNCSFCAVEHGEPKPVDETEPEALARAADSLGLRHVVITSVTRDDLPDGGAVQFASTIDEVRNRVPGSTVEVLIPDLMGNTKSVDTVIDAEPDVFNHNIETVRRLYPDVRPGADYERSLEVLAGASGRGLLTKSGFMVGLGETMDEVQGVLVDLRSSGCRLITVGQYLQPSSENIRVARYWTPGEFDEIAGLGDSIGFDAIAAGPLVRSSYFAGDMFDDVRERQAFRKERGRAHKREMARR